jgi:hypothetical protein
MAIHFANTVTTAEAAQSQRCTRVRYSRVVDGIGDSFRRYEALQSSYLLNE